MAEHSYEIVVKLEGYGGGGSGGGSSSAKKNPADQITASPTSSISEFIKNAVAIKHVTNVAKKTTSFVVSNVGLTTGNSESQQQAEFLMNSMGTMVEAGISAATNPAALVSMVLSKAMQISFNRERIDLERRIETESLDLSRQRAGVAFNRSRMGGAG